MQVIQFSSASDLLKHARLEWEADNARSEAWFAKAVVITSDDPTEFCRAVLKFVTELFDHAGEFNCRMLVWSETDIPQVYLPRLLETQDRLERVAEAHAKSSLSGDDLIGFLTAVRVELNSRSHHWHAEALTYYQQRQFALATLCHRDQADPQATVQRPAEKASDVSRHIRAQERQAVVMPILQLKKWTRNKWASKAGVSKNCVYEYLEGRRQLSEENRTALAEELGIAIERLPK
jgi:hypothetical protein